MKGREGKGPPSTDLLVCFPSRAHLTLMPKPICSPARPQDTNKRQHHHPGGGGGGGHLNHHHHLKKSINRNKVAGHASPVLWAKNKSSYGKEIDEPTSPKVTCAGQIKVKPKASSCKNWQSVMEEIERLHNHRKNKKRPNWVEALGFKKDVMQFLTCLRSIRFDFRCFGAFPSSSITSDDEDEDDDGDEDEDDYDEFHQHGNHQKQGKGSRESDHHDSDQASRTVFSKWFMVLQENNNSTKKETINNKDINKLIRAKFSHGDHEEETEDDDDEAPCAPPPNALLLMRCRSAPPKSWLEQKEEEDEEEEEEEDENEEKRKKEEEDAMEEEKRKKDKLIVMRCGTDFNRISSDIARETWVVGGIKEALSRSRSWKR
ncbi:OLC1v1017441C1 [Oldenlandia corymbosa var. corymbosa]|uniref:OLC1v1017441C1 n=1 Tax=Oldenlandia corymbosa var. corymbosa TaxID=529605 RepID=A0AAV1E9I3_OLDCO|nr:OLC1v1017441C1 [Oldenlandia corymbosa var. corymbosa]